MICSYPTYEEWKRSTVTSITCGSFSSYPTYEEWKRVLFYLALGKATSSYPTYEEWKPKQLEGKTNEEVAQFLSYL